MKTKITSRNGYLFTLIIGFLLLGACKQSAVPPALTWSAYNQVITEDSPLVFKLTQPAGIPMLIKAWGYETEFELTTTDLDRKETHSTRTPYIRLGPQFQLLEKREMATEVQVTLTPVSFTKNAHISVEAFSLPEEDQASKHQVEAYRLISDALGSTQSENKELWQEKVGKLEKASQILRKLGQDETRMWVQSYENLFTYFPLYQYEEAFTKSKSLATEAHQNNFPHIELFALQVQGHAYTERSASDSEEVTARKHVEAQIAYDKAMKIAEQHELEYEIAWIIDNKAVAYLYADDFAKGLKNLVHAEKLAEALSDQFLLTMVQTNIVNIQIELGNLSGAIEALTGIIDAIPEGKNPQKVSMIQAETAKIHAKLYEFPQAIEGMSSALKHFTKTEDQESTGRTRISLASAYFEVGNTTHALELLELALVDMNSANFGLGLYAAHKLLANIYRHLGQFEKMNQNRDQQLKYLTMDFERASYYFESAKDLYIQKRFNDSKPLFIKSQEFALTSKRIDLEIISSLYICLLEMQVEDYDDWCSANPRRLTLAKINSINNIRMKFEGLYLWAEIQLQAGKQNEAFVVLDELVNDIRFYRTSLPGVLGAWFWENNKGVFETYLKVAADRHTDPSTSAIESLKVIHKIKSISSVGSAYVKSDQTSHDDLAAATEIRTLIANMESGKSKLSNEELSSQLDKLILGTSGYLTGQDQPIEIDWFQEALVKLPKNSALLTIYPFGTEAYVWVADSQIVTLKKLKQHSDINSMLAMVKKNIRYQGNVSIQQELEILGRSLLQPVMTQIPETIFFLPLGEFNGFPLEALKVDGRYLIEQHQVINIRSLDSLKSVSDGGFLEADTRKIFISGSQSFKDDTLMDLPGASNELLNIEKIFNESDIHIAIGENLTVDAFHGPEIEAANIIHIASHAVLDVTYPELSRVYLGPVSANKSNSTDTMLVPADIRATHYNADLVFLSACQTSGHNQFTFDSNLGFVSEFIDSGAGAVVASLWPISDSDTALLVKDFYTAMKQSPNVATSLTSTKRAFMTSHHSNRVDVWAAFQLFK